MDEVGDRMAALGAGLGVFGNHDAVTLWMTKQNQSQLGEMTPLRLTRAGYFSEVQIDSSSPALMKTK